MMSGDTKSTEISATNPTQSGTNLKTNKTIQDISRNDAPPNPDDKVNYNFTLDYTKDQLNPLLKSTTKRIISIDSQFRPTTDKVSQLATDFTFNLSTPLKDVVNLKMNSVQIPYTWYTINNNFGSNFIYLKGNAPGINDGNYDISFTVPSGNYNAGDLVAKLNERIGAAKSRTDISFGNTTVSYDGPNSKATFNWDIKNTYNEYYYELVFSNLTSPDDKTSIPAFLGYNYQTYYPFRVYSDLSIDVSRNSAFVYTPENSNNTMTIQYYLGNIILSEIPIRIPNTTYDTTTLAAALNTQLAAATQLEKSQIVKRDMPTGIFVGAGKSHFEMDIRLNRYKIPIVANAKIRIVFPQIENPIWWGANSALGFKTDIIELGQWISESPVANAEIDINDSPYILFDCSDNQYNSPLNDISMSIPSNSYTLDSYLFEINKAIQSANNSVFSFGTTKFELVNTQLRITVDLTRTMSISDYTLDLSGTIFNDVFNFPKTLDLSTQTVFDSSFGTVGTYALTNPLIKMNAKNGSASDGVSYAVGSDNSTYSNLTSLQNRINQYFISFVDADGEKVLATSDISLSLIPGAVNRASARMEIKFDKKLRANKYKMRFVDNSRQPVWNVTDINNSWAYNLKIDREILLLKDYYGTGKSIITFTGKNNPYTIVMTDTNNVITIRPIQTDGVNGIYAGSANTRTITFTPGEEYSRDEIFYRLNAEFDNTTDSVNLLHSLVGIYTENNEGYTRLRLNINRTYSAKDYKLVFYDPFSFVTCSVGNSSVRNTTWDATLGWILGFRQQTEYQLTDNTTLTGDTVVSVNIYSYFMIVLEDYNLNRMTDGIVTTTQQTNDIALPSYANRTMIQCDPGTGGRSISTSVLTNTGRKNLTQKQITSATASLTTSGVKKYTAGSFTKDVLAIIPLKLVGLPNNSMYVINGSDLAGQERSYFGPVNLQRMTVKLVNDKGETVDLNGADWSMTILCEQMYNQK